MAWEVRRGSAYYYRSRREGGRVVRQYVGGGELGTQAARDDAALRAARDARERAELERHARLDAISQRLDDGLAMLLARTAQLLGSLGFHKHRGQWRRRR